MEGDPGVDHQLLAARSRPEDDTDVFAVRVGDLEAGVDERLLCRGHAEVHARLAAADGFRVHPLRGIEVADLARGLRLVPRDVEFRDLGQTGVAADEIPPGGLDVIADRADDPQSGDHDPPLIVRLAHAR